MLSKKAIFFSSQSIILSVHQLFYLEPFLVEIKHVILSTPHYTSYFEDALALCLDIIQLLGSRSKPVNFLFCFFMFVLYIYSWSFLKGANNSGGHCLASVGVIKVAFKCLIIL